MVDMVKSSKIHETALVSRKAKLGVGVSIGPFCIIGDDVTIGNNVTIHSHVSIECKTTIGNDVEVFPFVSFSISQDLKYGGEASEIIIGDGTILREHVTINNGSEYDKMQTVVGKNCLLMIGVHVAHDCIVGDRVIIANNTVLGGHVAIESDVIVGGMCAIHPKVTIGKGAIVGGMSGVAENIIPYGNAKNERAVLDGLNIIGMKRANVSRTNIMEMNLFFDELFFGVNDMFDERLAQLKSKYSKNSYIQYVINFIESQQGRGLCMPKK